MSLFQYPKDQHKRRLAPRQFKHYRSYKRYLQHEFARVCVYCRQPDSSSPNLNFGVDHYRPKGIRRFAHLICAYDNLYYCCGNCNSRKNNDWPADESKGPYVVNPCDYEMAAHLRFDSKTGRVEPRSNHGKHTEELLQLNDGALVQFRLGTIKTVAICRQEIAELEQQLAAVSKMLRQGKLSQADYDVEADSIRSELDLTKSMVEMYTGELPLPPLYKQRLGVRLLP